MTQKISAVNVPTVQDAPGQVYSPDEQCQSIHGSRSRLCQVGLLPVCFKTHKPQGARCSSVVRAFAHGALGSRIDPSWGGPIELFLVPASAPRLA